MIIQSADVWKAAVHENISTELELLAKKLNLKSRTVLCYALSGTQLNVSLKNR